MLSERMGQACLLVDISTPLHSGWAEEYHVPSKCMGRACLPVDISKVKEREEQEAKDAAVGSFRLGIGFWASRPAAISNPPDYRWPTLWLPRVQLR